MKTTEYSNQRTIGIFNDSFPPIMDGVSLTVENYAYWLDKNSLPVCVVTPKSTKYSDKNIELVSDWRQGRFYFENIELNLVFKELERQFNVNIILPETDNKYFTGEFNNKNLADALDIICIPMDLNYEIDNNNKITVRKKEH